MPKAPSFAKPVWDPARRTLSFAGHVVKCFRRTAPNQLLVLSGFHKAAWAARIANPFSSRAKPNRRKALRDTVANLNRRQVNALLHFFTEEHEKYVGWQVVAID